MKNINRNALYFFLIFIWTSQAVYAGINDSTVTDYDGNVYHIITIGNQQWLKEDLRSLHYADGTEIPGAAVYNNDENNAAIYGRLYSWDAAMRNSKEEGAQGAAPDGWHIPSDAEWKELENFLGGADIAGGKMKETGTSYWNYPNTGAVNSSGFSGRAGGEWDTPNNKFNLKGRYAVYWTSTEINASKARERYLAYNDAKSSTFDWYKSLKYSIRCVKDKTTDLKQSSSQVPGSMRMEQNYPNPFNPETSISYHLAHSGHVRLAVYNILGEQLQEIVNIHQSPGSYSVKMDGTNLAGGTYLYALHFGKQSIVRKMLLLK